MFENRPCQVKRLDTLHHGEFFAMGQVRALEPGTWERHILYIYFYLYPHLIPAI